MTLCAYRCKCDRLVLAQSWQDSYSAEEQRVKTRQKEALAEARAVPKKLLAANHTPGSRTLTVTFRIRVAITFPTSSAIP
jgi:hypothetical protein